MKRNSLKIISLLCIVQITTNLVRSTDSQYIGFGHFFESRPSHSSGSNRAIGPNSDVAQDLKLGRNCQIGSHCKIASGCSLGDNVRVDNYVRMERGTSIASNCQIMHYARLGPLVTMGLNSLMNPYAEIEENANIGSGCIMGQYSNIGPSAKLEQNVYAGDYCRIGSDSVIGQNAIIQPYARVPDDGHVQPNEMIIKTPTTSDLYKDSLPVNQIPQSDVELADQGQPEELNERVRQLISSQKQNVGTSCQQNAPNVDFEPIRLVISLYLIRYDGLDQFIQNQQHGFANIGGGGGVISLGSFQISEVYINGRRVSSSDQGANEKHFVAGTPKKILEPQIENDMVEMLALKEDSQRKDRVPGDTFCKTVSEIQSDQRKVKCDQSVDVVGPNQGSSRPPTNSYGPQNSQSNQQNIGNQQPMQQPQRPNQDYPNVPNVRNPNVQTPNVPNVQNPNVQNPNVQNPNVQNPNVPNVQNPSVHNVQSPNVQTPNAPNVQYPNVPNVQNPNQPNNGENELGPRPTHGHPSHNNAPERSNQQPQASPVNDLKDHPISNPPTENNQHATHHSSSNNVPDPTNTRYPNLPQSPPYLSDNNNNNGLGDHPNSSSAQPRQPPTCNQCNIQPDTSFGHNIELGNNVNIGESTTVGNNCKIQDNAIIGQGVKIGNDATVFANANIGNGCVLDDQSKVGSNVNIAPGSYVGKNCDVGANAFIGENAVVLDNAKVPDNGNVGANQMVMPTPTSADLYSNCAPIEKVPQNLILQQDTNNNLRQMMRGQIAQVRSYCQQGQQLLDFAGLASAKTIYLISLHGVPNFTSSRQNVMNKLNGSGNGDSIAYDKLMNEEHFIEGGQSSSIEVDVKGEMIVLLAIEKDFGRRNRVQGDSFCQTFMDIASNQRQVKCDKQ